MKLTHVDAVVLHAADLHATVAFYRALGLPLDDEEHDEGPLHIACDIGWEQSAHFAIFEGEPGAAPPFKTAGSTMLGFSAEILDEAWAAAQAARLQVVMEPHDVPWGRRFVLQDPDGRRVEINAAPG